jgi:hypothetical protein
VRVLQHGWKSKGSRFEKECKVIARKAKGIYIKDVAVEIGLGISNKKIITHKME